MKRNLPLNLYFICIINGKGRKNIKQKSNKTLPEIENDVVIAARHNIFVKYVTSILDDPCSNTLS